jgi:hypothetical protein
MSLSNPAQISYLTIRNIELLRRYLCKNHRSISAQFLLPFISKCQRLQINKIEQRSDTWDFVSLSFCKATHFNQSRLFDANTKLWWCFESNFIQKRHLFNQSRLSVANTKSVMLHSDRLHFQIALVFFIAGLENEVSTCEPLATNIVFTWVHKNMRKV